MSELCIKIFLSVFLVIYIEVAFVWPSFRVWRIAGINPLAINSEDHTHNYIGKWFKIVIGLIIFSIACFVLGEPIYQYVLPAEFLQFRLTRVIAMVLCVFSAIVTIRGHFDMGNAWRIGIDCKNETPLVQIGLFRFSRNPIFISMIVVLICIFIIIPNAITLMTLVLGYVLIQLQVRLEEQFLLQKHGEIYSQYCEKVGRWF